MRTIGEVVGVTLYENDVVVRRRGTSGNKDAVPRGEVVEFTRKSRQRLAFVASNTSVQFTTMVTLTYPREYPRDGRQVKAHLRKFLSWLRRDTRGCELLWFLEFQQRGAPHVHILIDYPLPRDREGIRAFRLRVAMTWYRICESGDRKHLAAGTRTERLRSPKGGARYAVKYAQKMRQKAVPRDYRNVGRFWGHTKGVKPVPKAHYRCTEDDIRGVLEGFPYAPRTDRPVWRVVYNRAGVVESYIRGELDKYLRARYTCAQRKYQADHKGSQEEG